MILKQIKELMMRKTGKRMSAADRAQKSFSDTLSDVNKMIRTDYGGRDSTETVMKKIRESHLEQGIDLSPSAVKVVANYAIIHAADQVASCRKRVKPIIEDCKRRVKSMEGIIGDDTPKIIADSVNGGDSITNMDF